MIFLEEAGEGGRGTGLGMNCGVRGEQRLPTETREFIRPEKETGGKRKEKKTAKKSLSQDKRILITSLLEHLRHGLHLDIRVDPMARIVVVHAVLQHLAPLTAHGLPTLPAQQNGRRSRVSRGRRFGGLGALLSRLLYSLL